MLSHHFKPYPEVGSGYPNIFQKTTTGDCNGQPGLKIADLENLLQKGDFIA